MTVQDSGQLARQQVFREGLTGSVPCQVEREPVMHITAKNADHRQG